MATPETVQPWPNGTIPYVNNHPEFEKEILAGMKTWESATGVRFVERTSETAYVVFTPGTSNGSNTSHDGYILDTVTNVNLEQAFLATHEIGHVLGLIHEHCRSDRDSYIDVIWSHVNGGHSNGNFARDSTSNNQDLPYNPESVMHYGASWQHNSDGDTTLKWIGSSEQGIHKDNGWEKLEYSDLQSANRLYLEVFPEYAGLVIYRKSTGYITCNYVVKKRGIPEIWSNHWKKEYSLMSPFKLKGKSCLITYGGGSGYLKTNEIASFAKSPYGKTKELWNTHWTKNFTLMDTYESGGRPHVAIYRAETGYIKTNKINDSGSITKLWDTYWTKKYSLMAAYRLNGKPHLVIYRAETGYIKTNKINASGSMTKLWETHWSKNYTLMSIYYINDQPHLVIYRADSGYINTNVINDDGSISELWNTHWSKDYTLMSAAQIGAHPYLVIYRAGSGYINTNKINSSGSIDEVWNTHWTKDYSLMCMT